MLRVDDEKRIRILTLDRPDALNAFNDAMYDAATDALLDAASAPTQRWRTDHDPPERAQNPAKSKRRRSLALTG